MQRVTNQLIWPMKYDSPEILLGNIRGYTNNKYLKLHSNSAHVYKSKHSRILHVGEHGTFYCKG